jgi:hypothetical protein
MGQKRGHYVPAFLLRRFAHADRSRGARICRLDRQTGRTNMADPRTEAQEKHMYRIVDEHGNVSMDAETALTTLEDKTAPILRKLQQPGVILASDERSILGLFVAMQRIRVPTGRAWLKRADERLAMAMTEQQLAAGVPIELPERGALTGHERAEMLEQLRSEQIVVQSPSGRQTALMFLAWESTAREIVDHFEWAVVRAPEGAEFVCSDNPVVHIDPTLRGSRVGGGGLGFGSSAYAMTTFPLDPTFALVITPLGRPSWVETEVEPRMVEEINFATYAWAERAIYGRNQKVVTDIRRLAKSSPRRVARYPRVEPRLHVPGETLDPAWAEQAARRAATLPRHMQPSWLREPA